MKNYFDNVSKMQQNLEKSKKFINKLNDALNKCYCYTNSVSEFID